MDVPAVSVIVTSFNRAQFLGAAIRSVLTQSFSKYELIIVDDGSTDATADIVEAFVDPRIRVIRHAENRGIPAARNTGLAAANGRYIAWLDSDDIARPGRIAAQVQYLDSHPATAMIGTCAGTIDNDGRRRRGVRVPPFAHRDIEAWLLFRSAFQQSSIMGRTSVLQQYLYRPDCPVCEDLDVFIRLSREHQVANLPRLLIDRRVHPGQTIRTARAAIRPIETALLATSIDRLGVYYTADDLRRHLLLGSGWTERHVPDQDYLAWAETWLAKVITANDCRKVFDASGLRLAATVFWAGACQRAISSIGLAASVNAFFSASTASGLGALASRSWTMRAALLATGIAR